MCMCVCVCVLQCVGMSCYVCDCLIMYIIPVYVTLYMSVCVCMSYKYLCVYVALSVCVSHMYLCFTLYVCVCSDTDRASFGFGG